MAKKCAICGSPLDDEAVFCGNCGAHVSTNNSNDDGTAFHVKETINQRKKQIVIIAIILVALAVLIGAIVLAFGNHNETVRDDNGKSSALESQEIDKPDISSGNNADEYVEPVVELTIGHLPYLTSFENDLSDVLSGCLDYIGFNAQDCGIVNYTAHDQRGSTLLSQYEDFVIALDYGPNSSILLNASIKDEIVQRLSTSMELNSVCIFENQSELEQLSKIALAPTLLLFEGNNYPQLIDKLWDEMHISFSGDEDGYHKIEYQYANSGITITLSQLYFDGTYKNQGKILNEYSSIYVSVDISSDLVSSERSSPAYEQAQTEKQNAAVAGCYPDWAYTSESNKFRTSISLMKTILLRDGVLQQIDFTLIENDYFNVDNKGMSNYFFEIKTCVDGVFTYISDVGIYYYVTAKEDCVTYRIYYGDIANEDFEYWMFDWTGLLIDSSTDLSMAEHTYSLLYGVSVSGNQSGSAPQLSTQMNNTDFFAQNGLTLYDENSIEGATIYSCSYNIDNANIKKLTPYTATVADYSISETGSQGLVTVDISLVIDIPNAFIFPGSDESQWYTNNWHIYHFYDYYSGEAISFEIDRSSGRATYYSTIKHDGQEYTVSYIMSESEVSYETHDDGSGCSYGDSKFLLKFTVTAPAAYDGVVLGLISPTDNWDRAYEESNHNISASDTKYDFQNSVFLRLSN